MKLRLTRRLSTLLVLAAALPTLAQSTLTLPPTSPSPAEPVTRTTDIEKGAKLTGEPSIPGLTIYPRVSGSTSTIPVGELLLARALGLNGELRRIPVPLIRKLTFVLAPSSSLALTFPVDADPALIQEFEKLIPGQRHRTTHDSYVALAQGDADLILVARQPSSDELKTAEVTGVEFDVRPVALDALVFIVNEQNDIRALSMEQIRGIYTGKIQNWKEVGGADNEIYSITRDRNSGSEELMKKLVMQERTMIAGGERMAMTMMGTLDSVERNKNSLAYSVYYYERIMTPRPTIKPIAVNGVLPSAQTIADRTYPLVEPVYVVTRKDITPGGPAATLRNWLLSSQGQQLIAASGYVSINAPKP